MVPRSPVQHHAVALLRMRCAVSADPVRGGNAVRWWSSETSVRRKGRIQAAQQSRRTGKSGMLPAGSRHLPAPSRGGAVFLHHAEYLLPHLTHPPGAGAGSTVRKPGGNRLQRLCVETVIPCDSASSIVLTPIGDTALRKEASAKLAEFRSRFCASQTPPPLQTAGQQKYSAARSSPVRGDSE